MTSETGTDAPTAEGLPPIGTAVHLDMNERLTIPIAPAGPANDATAEPDTHPALSLHDIKTIVEDTVGFGGDHRNRIREGMKRLTDYIKYLEQLRCDGCTASLGYHNYQGRTLCGPCANGTEPDAEPVLEAATPIIDTAAWSTERPGPGRYDIGADGALWVERWSAERHYSDHLAAELARIGALHTPYTDEHGATRCRGCIAGYDTRIGQLTHCAWPCPTERARTGEV